MACSLALFLLHPPSQGYAKEPSCTGIDIIFLIDQSGSMQYNDQYQIRSNAVRTAIDILGDNTIYACPGVKHRIAVIGFGDRLVRYIQPSELAPTRESLPEWSTQRQQLKDAVPVEDNLGGTDHAAALQDAAQILADWRNQPVDGVPRKRAVLLVTDGDPCLYAAGCGTPNDNLDRAAYMAELETGLMNPVGSAFPWRGGDNPDSVAFWMLGLRDQASPNAENLKLSEAAWQRIARGHGGDVVLLQSSDQGFMNADMTSRVATILDSLVGNAHPPQPCDQPITVDPYLSNVLIIDLFRHGAKPGIQPQDVNVSIRALRGPTTIAVYRGGRVTEGQGRMDDYTSNGLNEHYVFYAPSPGQYVVEVDPLQADRCKDIDVRVQQVPLGSEVQSPAAGATFVEVDQDPYYDPGAPIPFRVRLLAQGGQRVGVPLSELPAFPLDLQVTVRSAVSNPHHVEDVYALSRVDDAQAIYESKGKPLSFRYPGQYTWELVATTTNPRADDSVNPVATPIEVLRTQGDFSVGVRQRGFDFTLTGISASHHISLIDGAPQESIQAEVHLTGEDHQPLKADQPISPVGTEPFVANLIAPDGQALDPLPIHLVNTSTYSLTMVDGVQTNRRYVAGCYQVQVSLAQGYSSDFYTPQRTSIQVPAFCLQVAEAFTWQIAQPITNTSYPIYRPWQIVPQTVPLTIAVDLWSSRGSAITASDILSGTTSLISGTLRGPGAQSWPLEFAAVKGRDRLEATWPAQASAEGEYTLTLEVNKAELSPFWYSLSGQSATRSVRRVKAYFFDPWGLHIGLVIVLGLLVVYRNKQRPRGFLAFAEDGFSMPMHEERLGQFGGLWTTYVSRKRGLQKVGLSKIQVEKIRSGADTRRIRLRLYCKGESPPVFDQEMQRGNSELYQCCDGTSHSVSYQ